MNQKLFAFYSVMFCLLFNIGIPEKSLEELPKQIKDFEGNNTPITENKLIQGFVQEFSKIMLDFAQVKQFIQSFRIENVSEARIRCLTKIIEEINIMTHYSTRYTRIQKLILKWIDLAIESVKFSFRADLRTKNIIALKESIQSLFCLSNLINLCILEIEEETTKRKEFLAILDKETEEQPLLFKKINEKLAQDQESLEQKTQIRKELKKFPTRIENLVLTYYEKTNPIYSKQDLIKDYLLLICVYILQINK